MPSTFSDDIQKHRNKKRFGQNFLHDSHVLEQIIAAVNPNPNNHILEIGPGLGALTEYLIPVAKKIDIVEIDRDLIPKLNQLFNHKFSSQLDKISLHQQDALTFELNSITQSPNKIRIIGNLPYNISTPLLFHLLSQVSFIEDMHFMLQKEVVDRMSASTDNKHYGRLTVMMQYYCDVEKVFDVGPESFSPPPKVHSAIVKLTPHQQLPYVCFQPRELETLLAHAFSQRRKTIRNSLKKVVDIEQLQDAGIDPKLRPENIGVGQYVALCNIIHPKT